MSGKRITALMLERVANQGKPRSLQFIYNVGVKGQPPREYVDEYGQYFPGSTDTEMKYLWVSSLIPDDDVEAFTQAVMSYTAPTAKGMEEAANFTESPSMATQ